ncbi:MAG: argininosuccinate lyase [Deltaproteobacteria bacterium]|nr:argininosuccinate lyase [Deltaproteobacteria bacterium]
MNKPLWDKGTVLTGSGADVAVQKFCAGDDVVADRQLFPFDVTATIAHVNGLARIQVLTAAEATQLTGLLHELQARFADGRFVVDDRFEDGHTAIETFLVQEAGDVGKKVHTARSRNDQVLVAVRLWLKAQLAAVVDVTGLCARSLLERARTTGAVAMPGYTHLQRAMPTSLQSFFLGHVEGFLDSRDAARAALTVVDRNPLGTGAGFGVSLALDRDGVTKELGFADVVVSPQAAQNSRGKLELFALQALHMATLDVRRLAWDLSIFTTAEFAFARLPDRFTTGSSLMPNKRNPDVVELLRTLPAVVEGALAETQAVLSLPSSYHRDLQATKAPVLRAFPRALQGLSLVPVLIEGVEFDVATLRAAISPDLFATDRALELVVEGVPFRDAYRQAAAEIPTFAGRDVDASLAARVSLGGAGNAGLDRLERRLND